MQISRQPNAVFALGTALVTIGKVCDRRVAGPTDSNTILYLVLAGPTGSGKEKYLNQPKTLLAAAGMEEVIGPGTLASPQAVESLVVRKPNVLCSLDEM